MKGTIDHTGQFRHHPLASPAAIVWKVVGQHLFLDIIPNSFTVGTGRKVWCDQGRGVDRTGQFRHHPLASPAVIVWKVVGQHLFLNIIPSNFTAGTGRKVWCDWGMRAWCLDYGEEVHQFRSLGEWSIMFGYKMGFFTSQSWNYGQDFYGWENDMDEKMTWLSTWQHCFLLGEFSRGRVSWTTLNPWRRHLVGELQLEDFYLFIYFLVPPPPPHIVCHTNCCL